MKEDEKPTGNMRNQSETAFGAEPDSADIIDGVSSYSMCPCSPFLSLSGIALYTTSSSSAALGEVLPVRATGLQAGGFPRFTGEYISLLSNVNGNVAVSFFKSDTGDLGYVRSTSPRGATWPATVVYPDTTGNVGMWTSMAKLPGTNFPAIAYQDNT